MKVHSKYISLIMAFALLCTAFSFSLTAAYADDTSGDISSGEASEVSADVTEVTDNESEETGPDADLSEGSEGSDTSGDDPVTPDEKTEEEKAAERAAARAKVAACEKALKAATSEQTKRQAAYDNCGRVFIDNMCGEELSVDILTSLYKSYTKDKGKLAGYVKMSSYSKSIASVMSISNLNKAADFIAACNGYRQSVGADDLLISYRMMCFAATAAAVAYESNDHILVEKLYDESNFPSLKNVLSVRAENLAFAMKDPYAGWFTDEKELYDFYLENTAQYPDLAELTPAGIMDKYPNVYENCGHYLNLTNPRSKVTGFAHNTVKSTWVLDEQCFSHDDENNGELATPAEFKAALKTFYTPYKKELDAAKANVKAAQADLDAAKAELDALLISISGATIKGTKTVVYNGKAFKPAITVYFNGQVFDPANYTVSYRNNTNPGTATVIVTGIDAYKSSVSKTFKIRPKGTYIKTLKKAKKAFTVRWKKQATQTSGYQIQYSRYKSFKKSKYVTIKSNKYTSRKIKKLGRKKKYYVRIRTYKTVSGKRVYSNWSAVKAVKTK